MSQSRNTSLVLRKGAWTAEEDMLLKNYIEKFGESKWHLISLRAGLNRCRKSCRLRWVNYLRPNIKKGDFGEDEVDLMLRLHKLLGNRWALIAGRIPGRTANDIKNYWNTHLKARPKQQKEQLKDGEPLVHNMVTVIKPQPYTLSKALYSQPNIVAHDIGNAFENSSNVVSSSTLSVDRINGYLQELFDDRDKETDDDYRWSFNAEGEGLDVVKQVDDLNSMFDLPIDDVMLDFTESENYNDFCHKSF